MVDSILTEIDVSKKKKMEGGGSIVYFQFKKKIRLGIFEDVLSLLVTYNFLNKFFSLS